MLYRIFYLVLLLTSSLVITTGCGSTEIFTAHQKSSDIEINGNLSGWPSSDAIIHNSDSFDYYIMQDEQNLYVYVDFKSPFYNHAVENSGFIMYISEDEDNKKRRGLGYPSGAFNLLREDPASFRDMTRETDWMGNTQNQRRLESLQEENFNQVMIVERYEDSSDSQYGFVTFSQIEAEGLELAAARDRRYYGLEYKIPLDRSAPFELLPGKTYWIGFAIEPPEFNFRNTENFNQYSRQQGTRRGVNPRNRTSSSNQQAQFRRQLGQYEQWFLLEIN
jgi:hypothetical protein